MAELYGSISIDQARRFGYHNPRAELLRNLESAYQESLRKIAAQNEAAYITALSDCTASSLDKLYGGGVRLSDSQDGTELVAMSARAQELVARDGRIGVLGRDWRNCMAKLGQRFESMSDGRAQFQFDPMDVSKPSSREIEVAVADATCRLEVGADSLIATLYSGYLQQQIEQSPELLAKLESQKAEVAARAEVVLGLSNEAGSVSPAETAGSGQ